MEKFRSSADASTGIHPFHPVYGVGLLGSALALAPLRLAMRLPALVLGALLLIVSGAVPPLAPVAAKLLLAAFGCTNMEVKVVRQGAGDKPQVVIANHASFLDVLFGASHFKITRFVLVDGDSKRPFVCSALRAVLLSWRTSYKVPANRPPIDVHTLPKPVMILPEGTASNGRGVLPFYREALRGLGRGEKLTIVGFNYGNPRTVSYSATYTVGSVGLHIVKMLIQPQCELTARISSRTPAGEVDPDEVREAVSQAAQVPVLHVGLDKRREFEEHWQRVRAGSAYKQ